jgi:hypothetical protein
MNEDLGADAARWFRLMSRYHAARDRIAFLSGVGRFAESAFHTPFFRCRWRNFVVAQN